MQLYIEKPIKDILPPGGWEDLSEEDLSDLEDNGIDKDKLSNELIKPYKLLTHFLHCHKDGVPILDPYTNKEGSYILWIAIEELMLICHGKSFRYDPCYTGDNMRKLIRPHVKHLHSSGLTSFMGFRIRERYYYQSKQSFLECGFIIHKDRILEALTDKIATYPIEQRRRVVNRAHWLYAEHENYALIKWLLIEASFPGVKKMHQLSARNGDVHANESTVMTKQIKQNKNSFFKDRIDSELITVLKLGLDDEHSQGLVRGWLAKSKKNAKDSIAIKKIDLEWFTPVSKLISLYELVNTGEGTYNIYMRFNPERDS